MAPPAEYISNRFYFSAMKASVDCFCATHVTLNSTKDMLLLILLKKLIDVKPIY